MLDSVLSSIQDLLILSHAMTSTKGIATDSRLSEQYAPNSNPAKRLQRNKRARNHSSHQHAPNPSPRPRRRAALLPPRLILRPPRRLQHRRPLPLVTRVLLPIPTI